MNRVSVILLFTFFEIITCTALSQILSGDLPFRHYNTQNGLAGSNVYSFLQDENGYLWFATANGLSRFDGKEFENYRIEDGLLSNTITGIVEGGDSTIWVSSYDKGLNYIKNGKIFAYDIIGQQTPLIHHMIEKDGHIFIYGDYFSEIYKNKINKILGPTISDAKYKIPNFFVYDVLKLEKDNSLLILTSNGIYKFTNKIVRISNENKYYSCIEANGALFLGSNESIDKADYDINKIVPGNIRPKNSRHIQRLLVDFNSNIWFGQVNEGFYYSVNGKIIDLGKNIGLDKTQINFIKMDNVKNIWIGTFGKGIYCFYNLGITNFTTKNGLNNNFITSINKDSDNGINIGTIDGLDIVNDENIKHISTKNGYSINYIRDIVRSGNKDMFVLGTIGKTEESYPIIRKNNWINYYYLNCISLAFVNDNEFLMSGWTSHVGKYKLINNNLILSDNLYLFNKPILNVKVNKIFVENSNTYWFGTSKGLIIIKDKVPKYFPVNSVLSENVSVITKDSKGRIWAGGENGLLYYQNKKWFEVTRPDSISINNVTSLTFDNDNVWIGTLGGLYVLKDDNSIFKISNQWGLISEEIHSLYFDNASNKLWIGTNEGISKVDFHVIDKYPQINLHLYIENISTSKSTYSISQNLSFEPYENTITINLSAPYFKYASTLAFMYKFEGKQKSWTVTDNNDIQFASLAPGTYDLIIKAVSSDGEESNPVILSFIIATPFTSSLWFYVLIIVSVILSAVFVTKKVIATKHRKLDEKNALENKIIELKQQALAGMMNPHFIFNSLNSIQSFINNHNKNEANNFLSKFAKLIRLNLDIAQESFISLQEEIERLALYLSLEKMRFGENFNYSIIVDESINKKATMLPNMIIQPFVENAIWHGILPNTEKGNLKLDFRCDNIGNLIISIMDDGVGFQNSINDKNSKHTPRGINIIKERLELLHPDRVIKNILNIKTGNSVDSRGTTVEIILPMMNSQNNT